MTNQMGAFLRAQSVGHERKRCGLAESASFAPWVGGSNPEKRAQTCAGDFSVPYIATVFSLHFFWTMLDTCRLLFAGLLTG